MTVFEQAAKIAAGLKKRAYHLLFALTIISLATLVTWWSVFIRSSISQQREEKYETLNANLRAFALSAGHNAEKDPLQAAAPEGIEAAFCLQISPADKFVQLAPYWSKYCVRIKPEYAKALEDKFKRRTLMVAGESSTLILLMMISVFMLYRMIHFERRTSKEVNEFFSRVTHEIKTPITGIKALLQTMLAADLPRNQLEPLLQMALREVDRQHMLTENILIGQRMNRNAFGMQIQSFDLGAFAADYLRERKALLREAAVEFDDETKGSAFVSGDKDAMRVIMENLIDNALKYGGKPLKIKVAIRRDAKGFALDFADDGIGFNPAMSNAIFEAYKRLTDELPKGKHGTGMGLYLSRELARRMKGNMTARSHGANKGALFTVVLPAAKGNKNV